MEMEMAAGGGMAVDNMAEAAVPAPSPPIADGAG